jgi:hypothetical protein
VADSKEAIPAGVISPPDDRNLVRLTSSGQIRGSIVVDR